MGRTEHAQEVLSAAGAESGAPRAKDELLLGLSAIMESYVDRAFGVASSSMRWLSAQSMHICSESLSE